MRHWPACSSRASAIEAFYFRKLSAIAARICRQTVCIDDLVYQLRFMFEKNAAYERASQKHAGYSSDHARYG